MVENQLNFTRDTFIVSGDSYFIILKVKTWNEVTFILKMAQISAVHHKIYDQEQSKTEFFDT